MESELRQILKSGVGLPWVSLAIALVILGGWIVSVCLHEFGHAIVAYGGGDTTVKSKGYLTLNPLKYTDVTFSLVYPLLLLMLGGIALPGAAVYINTHLLRNRGWQSAVSAAGPIATGLVALLMAIPFHWGWASAEHWFWYGFAYLASLQVAALCFNLLPIPPLDGFGMIEPWLPSSLQQQLRRWSRYSFLVLIATLWTIPPAQQAFWSVVRAGSQGLGIPLEMTQIGYSLFRQASPAMMGLVFVGIVLFHKQFYQPGTKGQQGSTIDLEASLAAYDRAIESDHVSAEIWFGRGCVLGELQCYQEAIASYDQALTAQPDNPADCCWNRMLAQYHLKQYDAAVASFNELIQHKTPDPEHWYFYGFMLAQMQQYQQAIDSYDQVLSLRPDDAEVWLNRGKALYDLGDYDSAVEDLDRSIYLQPQLYEAWYRRGLIFSQQQHHQRALASFDQALSIEENEPVVWAAKGLALIQLEQNSAAASAYERAITLAPKNSLAWYNKACCHARQGQSILALECLQRAIQLDPDSIRELARTDPDFDRLHQESSFQTLLEGNGQPYDSPWLAEL